MWKWMYSPAKERIRGDWYRVGQLGMDALHVLSPVKNPLGTAWVGGTPARVDFAGGLDEQHKTVVRVWESVQAALWAAYCAEPERVEVWIP